MNIIRISLVLLCLGFVNPVSADHPVAGLQTGTSGAITTSSGKTVPKGSGAIGINFQHVDFDSFSNERLSELTHQHKDVHGISSLQRTSVDAIYGLTDRLTVGISVPFIKRNNLKETAHEGSTEEFELLGDSEGLGDTQLFGQLKIFSNKKSRIDISTLFGVNLPTGDTDGKSHEDEKLEVELQPGTGSIDPFLGVAVTKSLGAWNFDSNVLYTLATEGSQDTDLGDILNYNAALSIPFAALFSAEDNHSTHSHNNSIIEKLNLVLEINGEWRDRIEISDETENNSGGNLVYLSPGLTINTHGWLVSALGGWPIIDDLHGEQSDPEFRFVFKLTKLFGEAVSLY